MATRRPLNVEQLLSTISGSARGAHQSKLTEASVAALKGFADYLINVEGKSPNTARAYRSWAAKAMVEHGAHEPHVLSAVKALARYTTSKGRK
jgi:quinol monooxygenase YgiN